LGAELIGTENAIAGSSSPPPLLTKFPPNALSRSVNQKQKRATKERVISFHKTRMNTSLSTKMGYFAVSLASNSYTRETVTDLVTYSEGNMHGMCTGLFFLLS
jgi:hypothetical protein